MKKIIYTTILFMMIAVYGVPSINASYVDPTGSIDGRVKLYERSCDIDGIYYAYEQVSDVDVTLYDDNDKKIDSDDSNADGEFNFDDIDIDQKYYIKCEKKGYVDAKDPSDQKYKSGKFTVDANKTVTKNCRLMQDEPLDCSETIPVDIPVLEAMCGDAQRSYLPTDTVFIGDLCAVGTVDANPQFPVEGARVSWICKSGTTTEQCSATREEKVVKAATSEPVIERELPKDPLPTPDPTPQPEPVQKEPLQAVAAAGLLTGTLIAFATSAVPLFMTMPMAAKDIFIMPLIGLLARRRNEQNWGTVFEHTTKQPIPGVKITLNDATGKEIETTYSDYHGRFGFLTQNGNYVIDVEKMKYAKNFDYTVDPLYGDVYVGEPITIEENKMITINIAMNALNINWEEYAKKKSQIYKGFFSAFKKWLFIIIYYAGFIATVVVTYLYPTVINGILLSLYILLFIYDHFIKKKKYGTVETDKRDPIPFAIVSLYDKNSREKKSFAVTDVIGRYYLLAENGNYDMHIKGQPVGGTLFEKKGDVHVRDGLVRKDVRI